MTQDQFLIEFEHMRAQLKSYIVRMTASVDDTEDIVQETWLKAQAKLGTFRGESSLKTWVFAIASNLAKDNLRAQQRWTENVTDIAKAAALANPRFFHEAMTIRHTSAQGNFEISEHIAFCFACIAKSLPLEQHLCLLLKEVYLFKVAEIAQIVNVSEAMVKYYLHVARAKMTDIFDKRCALINKQGVCHQCSELNGIFNPKQNAQEALMKIEMAREVESGRADREHLINLRLQIVQGIDPFESGAAELQLHHLEHNRQVMEKYLDKSAT